MLDIRSKNIVFMNNYTLFYKLTSLRQSVDKKVFFMQTISASQEIVYPKKGSGQEEQAIKQ
jgi:hypothetical protein